jgi:hypothetical protein
MSLYRNLSLAEIKLEIVKIAAETSRYENGRFAEGEFMHRLNFLSEFVTGYKAYKTEKLANTKPPVGENQGF